MPRGPASDVREYQLSHRTYLCFLHACYPAATRLVWYVIQVVQIHSAVAPLCVIAIIRPWPVLIFARW